MSGSADAEFERIGIPKNRAGPSLPPDAYHIASSPRGSSDIVAFAARFVTGIHSMPKI
jgi:hypothetical protein